jgi:hypothetical protein
MMWTRIDKLEKDNYKNKLPMLLTDAATHRLLQ